MDSSSIIEKYKNSVIKEYWDLTLILYGSTVYGVNTSDLDICYLSDNKLSKQRFDRLKDLTRIFHLENGLRIDEEVPYDNKLVYSNDMVKNGTRICRGISTIDNHFLLCRYCPCKFFSNFNVRNR